MKTFIKKDALKYIELLSDEICNNKVFVYPTDTLYGIGVNALNKNAIQRLINIKDRGEKAFLIIPPSIEWIFENCIINNFNIKQFILKNTPGNISFILKLKNKKSVHPLVLNNGNTIGVRIPDNWFYEILQKSNMPFITTSANISGDQSPKNFDNINKKIINDSDYVIKCSSPTGKASSIVNLTGENIKILRK